jgi:hypothetical protein
LYVEAFHLFIESSSRIQGLKLPYGEEEVMDYQFVDDTTIYLDGQLQNLQNVECEINFFCLATGSKVN